MPSSSKPCWRGRAHDLPGDPFRAGNARSPFRIVSHPWAAKWNGSTVFWIANGYAALRKPLLRSYAMDLLHFLRWWAGVNHTDAINEGALSASVLLDYLRFQAGHFPSPRPPPSIAAWASVERALRNEFPDAATPLHPDFTISTWRRSPLGFGRPRPTLSRLRVKEPKRIVLPLSVDEVARFWSSFRTSRDLAIVGLMLLQGLRSNESSL